MRMSKVANEAKQVKLIFNSGSDHGFNLEQILEEMQSKFQSLAFSGGVMVLEALMNAEVAHLAGEVHERGFEAHRWGVEKGYVVLAGQKVGVKRPRLREKSKQEVRLESYTHFQRDDDRTRAVFSHLLAGMSCRKYGEAIEKAREGYGLSKSVISREMIVATSKQLNELLERDLTSLDVCVLVLDGICIGASVQIVALDVETSGKKHILGFREGATENSTVCTELLEDLIARGLPTHRPLLVILDGAKALRAAVLKVFGEYAEIQRCQFHKKENVKEHLPKRYHAEVERRLSAAYKMTTYADAYRALQEVVRWLSGLNESAAHSLEEGLEETITLHRLEIPSLLRRSFSTANLIDSAFSQGRTVMRNVKRWKNSNQIQRWAAGALLDAQGRFNKVQGYKSLAVLTTALETSMIKKKLVHVANVA